MVVWIESIGTPSAPAFAQSTSIRYCEHVLEAVGAHPDQPRVLRRQGEQLVAGGHQGLVPDAAAVLQLEVEAARPARVP